MQTILSQFSTQCKDYLLFKESFLNYIFKHLSHSMFSFSSPGASLMHVLDVLWLSSVTIIFLSNFVISASLGLLFSFLSSVYLLPVHSN